MGGKHRLKHTCRHKKNTWIKTGSRTGFHPRSRRTAYDGKVWKRKSGDGIRDSTHQSRIPKIPPPQIHSSPQKAEVTEELLIELEKVANNVEKYAKDQTYFLPLYALFLLAEFKEKRAFPIIIKLITSNQKAVDELLGDLIPTKKGMDTGNNDYFIKLWY